MRRKKRLIFSILLAIMVCAGAYFLNAFFGNPVSRALAKRTAERYIEENYPGFHIENLGFDLKTTGYYAHAVLPESADSSFSLHLDMVGNIKYDTYESRVLQRGNTADRLNTEYGELVDRVLADPSLPYAVDIGFGELLFWYDREADAVKEYSCSVPMSQLELDKQYDVSALGAEAGRLVVYIADEDVSLPRLTEILTDLTRRFDAEGIAFYMIDLILEYPRPTDDAPWREGRVEVKDFLYSDIEGEGLIDSVTASNEAAVAYYAEQGALKETEEPIN